MNRVTVLLFLRGLYKVGRFITCIIINRGTSKKTDLIML